MLEQEALTKRRVKRGWMNLEVLEIIQETPDTRTLLLIDQEERNRPFDYTPGQYLTFRFDGLADKPVVRSYTISSSPCQGDIIAVTVKEVENGFISHYLCRQVKVGDILRARGAIGKFCYEPEKDRARLGMIAAGSGVTPFISIMREFAPELGKKGYPQSMSLLVSYRSRGDIICRKELAEIASYPNSQVFITLSRENLQGQEGFWYGRIASPLMEQAFSRHYHDTTFMTCGPEAMMALVQDHLRLRHVPSEHVKTESFAS